MSVSDEHGRMRLKVRIRRTLNAVCAPEPQGKSREQYRSCAAVAPGQRRGGEFRRQKAAERSKSTGAGIGVNCGTAVKGGSITPEITIRPFDLRELTTGER